MTSSTAESVYSVVALVGTSTESWEKAAAVAIETASGTLRDLRVARVVEQDVHIEPGKPLSYRVKIELSFKYERTTWPGGRSGGTLLAERTDGARVGGAKARPRRVQAS